jgi:hypothetical protein
MTSIGIYKNRLFFFFICIGQNLMQYNCMDKISNPTKDIQAKE